jgi:ribosome biogenesis protein Tsr3
MEHVVVPKKRYDELLRMWYANSHKNTDPRLSRKQMARFTREAKHAPLLVLLPEGESQLAPALASAGSGSAGSSVELLPASE